MTMAYIRSKYNVPARKGMQVKVSGKLGMITGTQNAHLMILLDGEKHATPHHPTYEIDYLLLPVGSFINDSPYF